MDRVPAVLTTRRLVLRPWAPADRDAFAALNADPEVMRHFPALLSRAESDALADRIARHFAVKGYGPWAVEVRGGPPFIGFTGLGEVPFDAPFTPAVEVGWRLARAHWGHGFASEAAAAALTYGFDVLGLHQIVSFTVPANARSRRVMARIGMRHDEAGAFDHPRLPAGHPLRRHVLYRKRRIDDFVAKAIG